MKSNKEDKLRLALLVNILCSIFSPISVKDVGVECGRHSRNKVDMLFGLTPERIIFQSVSRRSE